MDKNKNNFIARFSKYFTRIFRQGGAGLVLGAAAGATVILFVGYIGVSAPYFHANKANTNTENKTKDAFDNGYSRGSKNAKTVIIVFSDFQCPYCAIFYDIMKRVINVYPDNARWTFKHFPLKSHIYARKAAEAAECAGEQNKFWEYADKLFNNQKNINNEYFPAAAKELELNIAQFKNCLSSGKMAEKVNRDYNQGKQAGAAGAPASLINGELIQGVVPFKSIKTKIENSR